MVMTKAKKWFYTVIIGLFLIAGLFINYELDRDFLSQFGFDGFFVIISIGFFIGIKILTEFLFFRVKGVAKYFLGGFALFLIIASILSIFFVRIFKSETLFQEKENVNLTIEKQNREVDQNRGLILSQIYSLEKQVSNKQAMIKELDPTDSKWLRHRYSKDIIKLNTQKLSLLKELKTIKKGEISLTKKETTLHGALNRVFGTKSNTLTLSVNLIFTLIVDGALILLCFGLSFITKEPLKSSPEMVVNNSEKVVNLSFHRPESLVNRLKIAVNDSPLNQNEFAKKKLGISKVALWKIMNGKTKKISSEVEERIKAVV